MRINIKAGYSPNNSSLPREKAWAEILATTKRASDPSMPVQIDLFDVRRGESLGVLAGMCAGSR
jgi:hypothetical protein